MMTVAELIEELQKHPPAKPVRMMFDDSSGAQVVIDADTLTNEGSYVLIDSK